MGRGRMLPPLYVALLGLTLAATQPHHGADAFLPASNPPWPPTYSLQRSLITMACNLTGWYNASFASQFGIVSFDWSNAKAQWAQAKPMDCEERLLAQAQATKAADPRSRPFLYRNLVKALPWFRSVREKLADPRYSQWFLKFKDGGTSGEELMGRGASSAVRHLAFRNGSSYHVPPCDTNYHPPLCSHLYHDQLQTPQVPTPEHPTPDGACSGVCDCGAVPCGEYVFDHRNASLRDWLVREHIGGPTGVDSPAVHGLFIDDFWCSDLLNGTGNCTDPVQGPTEMDPYSQLDMGLSDLDIEDITRGWLQTMTAAQEYVLSRGKYTWSLIEGQENADAQPFLITRENCMSVFQEACSEGVSSVWQTAPRLFGLTPGDAKHPLPLLEREIAAFQVLRGPYTFLGYGVWGMSWPVGSSFDFSLDSVPLPDALKRDYGQPLGLCQHTGPTRFQRLYQDERFVVDCATWPATPGKDDGGIDKLRSDVSLVQRV